jgi:hypothetical protein
VIAIAIGLEQNVTSRIRLILLSAALAIPVSASTFVVPSDRDMVQRADAIVIANAAYSASRPNGDGGIETVTQMFVEEVIKGNPTGSLTLVEPGGTYGGSSTAIPGVPQFIPGQRLLLFLLRTGPNRWAVADLVLGKFSFVNDDAGRPLLLRDAAEIVGWDSDLKPHVEVQRSAPLFLDFVRREARGASGATDYVVAPAPVETSVPQSRFRATTMIAPYTATSYSIIVSGSMGARWTVFPSPVSWFTGTTQEPGAPGGGVTAVQTGIASWNNDCPSNVNYAYAGTDNGTHTQGLHAADGANTVLFERDLSSYGITPFSCSGTGYSGTLGIGGVTSASGTNSVSGETFATTIEGDVEMNKGIANCTLLFNNGDFNTAVTHELGHTLGFRHSDQTRSGSAACTTDPSLECSNTAVMKSFVPTAINGALQAWDQHAVQALYPGGSCGTTGTKRTLGDFNGDHRSDTTVYRSAINTWYVRNVETQQFGIAGDMPVPDDYDGDAKEDLAVFRPSTRQWFVLNSSTGQVTNTAFGVVGDQPVPADYDGDKRDDIAVYRPSTGFWYILNSSTGAVTARGMGGVSGDQPVPGDYDGDGKADAAIYRASTGTWYILNSSNNSVTAVPMGISGDVPVPADYDGDGKTDIAVFRPSTGQWFVYRSSNLTVSVTAWGAGDTPVPGGDYDGDGKYDIAVYRPSTGYWYIVQSSNGATLVVGWGYPGDTPIHH